MHAQGEVHGIPTLADLDIIQPLELAIWANDGKEGQARGLMFLTVRPANSPPDVTPIPDGTMSKGVPFTADLSVYFHDPDDDQMSFFLEGAPLGTGLVLDRHNAFMGGIPTQADLDHAPLVLRVIADDGRGGTARNAFRLNILPPNNLPIVSLVTNAVATQGTPFYKDLSRSFADPDGDKLVFQLNGLPLGSGLTINPGTGVMEGVPTVDDVSLIGPWPLRVQAIDGKGGFSQGQFFLTVKPLNTVPNATDMPPLQTTENRGVSFDIRPFFSDADDHSAQSNLAFSIRGLPPGTGLRLVVGVVQGAPSAADRLASPMSLTVTAVDGAGGQASGILFVVVTPANLPPKAKWIPPTTFRVAQSVRLEMAQYFSDPDKHVLGFDSSGLPIGSGLSVDHVSGVLYGSPSLADLGAPQPLNVDVMASDGHGGVARAHFVMTILPANHPPVPIGGYELTMPGVMGQPVFLHAAELFSDIDQDILTYGLWGLAPGSTFTIDSITGFITGSVSQADCDVIKNPGDPVLLNVTASDGLSMNYVLISFIKVPARAV